MAGAASSRRLLASAISHCSSPASSTSLRTASSVHHFSSRASNCLVLPAIDRWRLVLEVSSGEASGQASHVPQLGVKVRHLPGRPWSCCPPSAARERSERVHLGTLARRTTHRAQVPGLLTLDGEQLEGKPRAVHGAVPLPSLKRSLAVCRPLLNLAVSDAVPGEGWHPRRRSRH